MRHHHPNFNTTVTGRLLRSVGSLQPTPTSRSYAVIMQGKSYTKPVTISLDPRSDMTIATTIVPWLSLWLYYYEIWLATGSWQGGGVDHEPKSEKVDVSHT